MLTSFKRIIKTGWLTFSRNIGPSIATVFIMVMVIFLISFLFLLNTASGILISSIQEKVDISVYFKEDASPEDILAVKAEVSKIPEVKEVEYISKEKALEKFIERHRDDPVLMESLTEVGKNPFLASLSVKAWQPTQYEEVNNFLENFSYRNLIEKIDYHQRKPVIDRLFAVTSAVNKGGVFFSIILGIIAVLVTFSAVRIAIYNSNEEISTMRLVGASNWFIRGPFLIQGAIAGILATLIALLITFAVSFGFNSKIEAIAPEVSTTNLFISNFWTLLLIQLALGIGLGIISSTLAIRRYLDA